MRYDNDYHLITIIILLCLVIIFQVINGKRAMENNNRINFYYEDTNKKWNV